MISRNLRGTHACGGQAKDKGTLAHYFILAGFRDAFAKWQGLTPHTKKPTYCNVSGLLRSDWIVGACSCSDAETQTCAVAFMGKGYGTCGRNCKILIAWDQ